MTPDDLPAPLWSHLEELRTALIRSVVAIAIGTALCLCLYQPLFSFLTFPFSQPGALAHEMVHTQKITNHGMGEVFYTLPSGASLLNLSRAEKQINPPDAYAIAPGGFIEFSESKPVNQLVIFGPVDGIMIVLKTSFWGGFVLSSPLWLFFIFQFIAPGLYPTERKYLTPFLFISIGFIGLGMAFAYLVTIPIANQFLLMINNQIGQNLWSVSHYLDYTVNLMLANGLAFESVALLGFLVSTGFLSTHLLTMYRKHVYVAIFIISAVLTPPDVLTQLLLAFPLIGLYECVIGYSKVIGSPK